MIKIELLTDRTLRETVDLVDKIFPEEEKEPPKLEIPASLNPEKYQNFLLKHQMSDLRYWVAIDDFEKVVGTIGLYCYDFDEEEAFWLGWFCVDPKARKQDIGTQLLEFSIEKAREQGKTFLRLYTSSHPDESDAHRLYEKHGFVLVGKDLKAYGEFSKLYYELRL